MQWRSRMLHLTIEHGAAALISADRLYKAYLDQDGDD
jgi:hypothetical protein